MKSSAALWFLSAVGSCSFNASSDSPSTLQPEAVAEWKTADGGNGHFYRAVYSPAGVNWEAAEFYAVAHGGYLATIGSAAENDFVFQQVTDLKFWIPGSDHNAAPWLGGIKSPDSTRADDGWQWIHNDGPFTYTHWYADSSEPNNVNGAENRLQFTWRGPGSTWNDVPMTDLPHGFVVEYDQAPPPIPVVVPASPKMFIWLLLAPAVLLMIGLLVFIGDRARRRALSKDKAEP